MSRDIRRGACRSPSTLTAVCVRSISEAARAARTFRFSPFPEVAGPSAGPWVVVATRTTTDSGRHGRRHPPRGSMRGEDPKKDSARVPSPRRALIGSSHCCLLAHHLPKPALVEVGEERPHRRTELEIVSERFRRRSFHLPPLWPGWTPPLGSAVRSTRRCTTLAPRGSRHVRLEFLGPIT